MTIGTAPCLAHAALVSGRLSTLSISAFSLSTIGLGRAGRRHEPEPDGRLVAGHPGLGDGRHVGQQAGARLAGRAERPHLAALHGRRGGGDGIDHHLDVAAEHGGAGVAAALCGTCTMSVPLMALNSSPAM